ncbi:hypothetical protein DEJ13_11705 [Curtobacterium sp. MCLR17_007]|uniref:hypothetical protein n=1 Tax=Curtobacterium sp. MCLR17_007 TaxID=2175648 RepID=UPI0024DF92AC|nr:hypothetical protein [Curtobacterium sp. MCLR17_007]WIB59121.1 hypothetical protein DEJ13_11705 [Curtobacterium sp. MCLR17_007]
MALIRTVDRLPGSGLVVSHRSAVAMHGLPWIGTFGDRVVIADPTRDRGQTKGIVRRVGTAGRVPEAVILSGLAVTSLVVTAVDVALAEHPWRAIVVLDAVLRRGVTRAALDAELHARGAARARRRAAELIQVADAAAESPGESITRWGAHVLGAPEPILQHGFDTEWGTQERVDFWYPTSGTVIEFDGAVKYHDARLRKGRSADEVVVEEKRREDALRRKPEIFHFGRVVWADAMPGGQLPRRLHDAGVPLGPNWAGAWRAATLRSL